MRGWIQLTCGGGFFGLVKELTFCEIVRASEIRRSPRRKRERKAR